MFNRRAYTNTTIRLRPAYNHTWNWGDFYGSNGEVVVTAFTLRDHLENEYTSQVHDEDSVDIEVPTVHLMDTHYEDDSKVDESYLIVTEEEDITPSVMREYLYQLEDQFDRQFELTDDTFDGIPYLSQG